MKFFIYIAMTPGQGMPRKGPPSPEEMAEIARFHEEQMKAGTIVATGRLGGTTMRVRREGDDVVVTDGPFIEGKELIPGFTIIDVPDREEALAWATRYRDMMGMPELRIAEIMV